MTKQAGGCPCGQVRYEMTGEPLTLYLCHCTDCQRRTGSAFGMTMHVPSSNHHVTQGKTVPIPRGKVTTHVCGTCGSWVFNQRDNPDVTSFPAGTLDDTSTLKPQANVWTRSAQPWVAIDAALDNYTEQPARWRDLYSEGYEELCR